MTDTARVYYAFADSPLGRMLVVETDRGLCGLAFSDSDVELAGWLAVQFPTAMSDEQRTSLVGPVLRMVKGEQVEIPLDVRGTPFQVRVWEALRTIPYGRTWTYEDLARNVGHPGAVRAVAHACATNRIAVAIPCHRVIRKNGGLGGYRWGLERKRRLLDREACS
jgi:AraC family transcriptional regulator, regulatory protein of adaptative response / methylated-DNA-[protein]-cysteine methyltransferase